MSDRPIGLAPGAELEAAGQDAKKYGSNNPVVRRLIDRWLKRIASLLEDTPTLADIGVGEALALERVIPRSKLVVGVDFRHDKLLVARQRVPILRPFVSDAGMLPFSDASFDTVICIEVLEHLTTTEPAIAELARITRNQCVVSVPWEPFFRLGNLARGKNMSRIGNDPEHVQQFSPSRLRRALEGSFESVRIHRTFPWIVAVARKSRHP